jgi:predicted ribosome quality control (RQC) complex YloA/Tae2 family protein
MIEISVFISIFSVSSAKLLTVKTPSFIEFQTLVESISDELIGSQLQEVQTIEDGLVLVFYRFVKNPKLGYLVFDLDRPFPFVGLFFENPWPSLKKVKPVGLFINSHVKNLSLSHVEILNTYGRVVRFSFGLNENQTQIEFRMIPRHANLIVTKDKKSISWYPVKELSEHAPAVADGESQGDQEVRSIPFIQNSWLNRRGISRNKKNEVQTQSNPYEKWKLQKLKDISKKTKAIAGIQQQIEDFLNFPWAEIGDHLKTYGIKNLKPEWHQHLNFEKSVSENIQNCFAKAKAAKSKIIGARARLEVIEKEVADLADLSEQAFQSYLKKLSLRQVQKLKSNRVVEGRFRKLTLEDVNLICYMGKSAKDNIDLLRKAKAWDYWIHLKDYPSAHAIIHRQKDQNVSDATFVKVSEWLVKESLNEKKVMKGAKFAIVFVECRHVRPIKGDKLGRVTYHDAREILIAI